MVNNLFKIRKLTTVSQLISNKEKILLLLLDAVRVQRSPQGGLLNDDGFEDYSDDAEGRHLHKRKHKRKHHGGFGCNRKHGCGG